MQMNGLLRRKLWELVSVYVILTAGFCFGGWIEFGNAIAEEPVTTTVLRSDETGTEFMVSVNRLQSDEININGDIYQKLSIHGESATWQVGCPEVPKIVRIIAIPPTGNVKLSVVADSFTLLDGIKVPPAQEHDLWDIAGANQALVFDGDCYEADAFYPASLAEISDPMIARDLRVVAVTIYPVQYNPASNQLKVYTDLTVSIEHTGGTGLNEKQFQHPRPAHSMLSFYRGEVLNFDQLGLDDHDSPYGTILIICYNNTTVLNEVSIIAEWKRKKGYNVEVVTTSQTGTSSSAIYNYILSRYNDPNLDPPLEYVMMVGDGFGSYGVSAYDSNSDFGYSLLEGSDYIAEIAIGRLSFSTFYQLQIIRKKILKYETDPFMGGSNPDWFQDAWMYAGSSFGVTSTIHTKEYVRQLLLQADYQNVPLSIHNGLVSESVIQSHLNAGVSIWNHRPAWIDEIFCSDLDELNNGWMMPVCLNLTCGSGNWVSSTSISECLLRAGTTVQPQGAIAAIATATSGTHTAFNNAFDGSFFHALITLGEYCVGDALAAGKAHFMWQYQGSSTAVNFIYWNSLMGDPSLEVWTDTPAAMTADYPSSISVGTNMVTVSVLDGTSQPLAGAYVHAYKPGETAYGEMTDASGVVTLPVTTTTPDTLFITVTKHNFKSVLVYSLVQSASHYVAPVSVVIDDDNSGYSHGNNDGTPNPGEGLEVNVTLKNWGSQPVNGVSATMSTADPYINSIDNATVYYGDISAGGQVTPNNDFELTLAATIPDDHHIDLLLEITDNTLSTYQGLVVLEIKEIDLEYVSHNWLNSGDGIFHAGETVDLEIELTNVGQVDAPSGITATALVSHPLITVLDATGTWSAITQGASAFNASDNFQLYADTSLFSGTPFQVTLYLENASGFRDTVIFDDTIGTVSVTDPMGPDDYGYYAFDNGDVFYSKRPSYTWVEIDVAYSGAGTELSLPDYGENQDVSVLVALPFPVQYYGHSYSNITVCSNGWLAFGDQSSLAYHQNWRIPGALGALVQVSALWDDFQLIAPGNGGVWKYFDSPDHKFIIEWSRMYNLGSGDIETFQVIIFDEDYYPTPTVDAEILIQYHTVTNLDYSEHYASVGIDNQDQSIGMEYTFNNRYPDPAAPLTDGRAILFTTDQGTLVDPPNIIVSPLTVFGSAPPGDSTEAMVTISNTGASNLDYSIHVSYNIYDEVLSGLGQVDGSGGPDDYGYIWIDSDELGGPEYSWVEISTIGTHSGITGNEQNSGPFNLGFPVDFYGNTYHSIRICSNGWLSFTSTVTNYSNRVIPTLNEPNSLVAPFWDDLNPYTGGDIYYYQDTANQRFIVQFDEVDRDGYYGGPYTFEVILYASGTIVYQYQNMVSYLTSATVGIENSTGTDGLQVTYNQSYIHNSLAVAFYPTHNWLQVEPLSGVVEPSGTDTLNMLLNASDLDFGTYEAEVLILNTDPNNSTVVVPVTFTVANEPPPPPAVVSDLVISVQGDDVALNWLPVTENINGDPITVSEYIIYADVDLLFLPLPGNQIGTTTGTSFTHTNAITAGDKLFYVVTAVE